MGKPAPGTHSPDPRRARPAAHCHPTTPRQRRQRRALPLPPGGRLRCQPAGARRHLRRPQHHPLRPVYRGARTRPPGRGRYVPGDSAQPGQRRRRLHRYQPEQQRRPAHRPAAGDAACATRQVGGPGPEPDAAAAPLAGRQKERPLPGDRHPGRGQPPNHPRPDDHRPHAARLAAAPGRHLAAALLWRQPASLRLLARWRQCRCHAHRHRADQHRPDRRADGD